MSQDLLLLAKGTTLLFAVFILHRLEHIDGVVKALSVAFEFLFAVGHSSLPLFSAINAQIVFVFIPGIFLVSQVTQEFQCAPARYLVRITRRLSLKLDNPAPGSERCNLEELKKS